MRNLRIFLIVGGVFGCGVFNAEFCEREANSSAGTYFCQAGAHYAQEVNVMAEKTSKSISSEFLIGVAVTAVGILFCAFRASLVSVLLTVVGATFALLGVAELTRRKTLNGVIEIAAGAIIVICAWTIVDVTLILLGVMFCAYAVYSVISALPMLKRKRGWELAMSLLYPLLAITVGALLIAARWTMGDALFISIGVLAIVAGVVQMFSGQLVKIGQKTA